MIGKNHWVLEVWVGIKVKLQYKTLILIQIARLDVIQKFQGSLITFCDLPFTKMGDISNVAIIAEINFHCKSCEIHKHKALNRRCIPQTLSEYKFLSYLHAQNLIGFHCCEPELWNTFLCNIQVSQDQHQFNNMDAIGLIIYAEKNPQVVQRSSK